jgi:hypothetical protein
VVIQRAANDSFWGPPLAEPVLCVVDGEGVPLALGEAAGDGDADSDGVGCGSITGGLPLLSARNGIANAATRAVHSAVTRLRLRRRTVALAAAMPGGRTWAVAADRS